MKTSPSKLKKLRAAQRKARLGRCLAGASLMALAAQAQAGGLTPDQAFEGGTNSYSNWIELSTGALLTSGNKNQAEQRDRLYSGAFGGIEDLHYQDEVAKKTMLKVNGRAIFDDRDYKANISLEKEGLGFLRLNYENFRTWDAGDGGFSPTGLMSYALPGDALALDRGNVSLEAGYNQNGKPKVTFKYTHTYRNGEKSSTSWGIAPGIPSSPYRIYPGILAIDETSDAFQLDVTHRIKSTDVGLGVRYEFGQLNEGHKLYSFSDQKITDQQNTSFDMVSAHGFTETWIKDNLFLSTGFMFTDLDNTFTGSRVYGDDFDVIYSPAYPANYYGYYNLNGGSHEHEYVVNVNLMSQPTKNLTITPSLRIQKEDWDAHSAESVFDPGGATDLNSFNNTGSRDSLDVCEQLEARYTGITNWVYTATAQLTEGQGSLDAAGGITQLPGAPDGQLPVQFRTDDSRLFQKYSVSARWYPLQRANIDVGGYYKLNQYDYSFSQDSTPNGNGAYYSLYPAFLTYQGLETWDGYTRLTLRPFNKVTLVSRYEYQDSTISTKPDPASGFSEVDSSRMQSHLFGQNASWTPLSWLGLQAGFNYVVSTTKTGADAYAAVTQEILNAQNNYWTVNFNSIFTLDDKTELNLGYFYYRADNSQNAVGQGLIPFGADQQEHSVTATLSRRITQNLRWNVKYAFTHYEDFAAAGNFNFDAHVIFTSLQYRF